MSKEDLSCAQPARRRFLGGLVALGAGMFMRGCAAPAPNAADDENANLRLIDMHHHFASPGWIKKLKEDGALNPGWEGYSPAKTVEMMDKAGIQMAFASPSTPGVWLVEGFGNNAGVEKKSPVRPGRQTMVESRMLTRELNEFGAKMLSDYKGRFGILAALALPDIDGSLKEIEYAFDTLKLQGIGLLTSYGNRWLGDPKFTPVFEELNRRKAVIFTHQTLPPCCRELIPGETAMEFSTDSSRAIASWIVSGAAKHFPDIQWIYSHGGGSLVASRFLGGEGDNLRGEAKPDSRLYYLRKYYYDTISSNEATLGALKKTVEASQIVFGYFDIPRPRDVPAGDARKRFKVLADTGVFTEAEIRGIAYQNALRLFPQYA